MVYNFIYFGVSSVWLSFESDAQEEYQIKKTCLTAVIEMILSSKMFPQVGDRFVGIFHHNPRLPRPKVDTIR